MTFSPITDSGKRELGSVLWSRGLVREPVQGGLGYQPGTSDRLDKIDVRLVSQLDCRYIRHSVRSQQ